MSLFGKDTIEPKPQGKTYTFTKEEREAIESRLGIINIYTEIIESVRDRIEKIVVAAKRRVLVDPFKHVQINYQKWTFFVPDIKVKTEISDEIKRETKS